MEDYPDNEEFEHHDWSEPVRHEDLVNLSNAEFLRKIMGPQRMGLEVLIKKIHRKLG